MSNPNPSPTTTCHVVPNLINVDDLININQKSLRLSLKSGCFVDLTGHRKQHYSIPGVQCLLNKLGTLQILLFSKYLSLIHKKPFGCWTSWTSASHRRWRRYPWPPAPSAPPCRSGGPWGRWTPPPGQEWVMDGTSQSRCSLKVTFDKLIRSSSGFIFLKVRKRLVSFLAIYDGDLISAPEGVDKMSNNNS